jgi:hypothetical protein
MIQIDTSNSIIIDGVTSKLCVVQNINGTRVYARSTGEAMAMPSARYNLTTDRTVQGVSGVSEFEADIKNMIGWGK